METQTSQELEGAAVPTPTADMSNQDSALQADQQSNVEAKPAELKFAEEVLGREFSTVEEAKKAISNLNSFVGDQTISKQRKALESLAKQANLSTDELIEVIDAQGVNPIPDAGQPVESIVNPTDATTKRVVRIETDAFVRDVPEAAIIKDTLFAEALQTGKTVNELWASKYAPIVEAGKKLGAKKLQTTTEGQPLKASSAELEQGNTKLDFSKMSLKEMEKHLGYVPPAR